MQALKGEDKNDLNYGGNLLTLNSKNKPSEFGVKTTQGLLNYIIFNEVSVNYMLKHNFYLEYVFQARSDSHHKSFEFTNTFGLRWNIQRNPLIF